MMLSRSYLTSTTTYIQPTYIQPVYVGSKWKRGGAVMIKFQTQQATSTVRIHGCAYARF